MELFCWQYREAGVKPVNEWGQSFTRCALSDGRLKGDVHHVRVVAVGLSVVIAFYYSVSVLTYCFTRQVYIYIC